MKIKPTSTPGQVVVQLTPRDDLLLDESLKQAAHAPFRLKKIVVPTNFSACSQKALQYALPFAEEFGARIVLVHVVEPVFVPENLLLAAPELPELGATMVTHARNKLARISTQTVPAAIKVDLIVRVGRPYQEIIEAARAEDADLIVIATHGYTGVKHVFMGSTAERVVRHSPCPVLTVREAGREPS